MAAASEELVTEPVIPTTADDVEHDFDVAASPPPGRPRVRSLLARAGDDHADPGHLAEDDEWAEIVARAEGRS